MASIVVRTPNFLTCGVRAAARRGELAAGLVPLVQQQANAPERANAEAVKTGDDIDVAKAR